MAVSTGTCGPAVPGDREGRPDETNEWGEEKQRLPPDDAPPAFHSLPLSAVPKETKNSMVDAPGPPASRPAKKAKVETYAQRKRVSGARWREAGERRQGWCARMRRPDGQPSRRCLVSSTLSHPPPSPTPTLTHNLPSRSRTWKLASLASRTPTRPPNSGGSWAAASMRTAAHLTPHSSFSRTAGRAGRPPAASPAPLGGTGVRPRQPLPAGGGRAPVVRQP